MVSNSNQRMKNEKMWQGNSEDASACAGTRCHRTVAILGDQKFPDLDRGR